MQKFSLLIPLLFLTCCQNTLLSMEPSLKRTLLLLESQESSESKKQKMSLASSSESVPELDSQASILPPLFDFEGRSGSQARSKQDVSSSESSFEVGNAEITFNHFLSACEEGKAKTLKKYIKAGFSPASFGNSSSLLYEAFKLPSKKGARIVRYLLQAGVGVGPCDESLPGWISLHSAAYDGSTDYVRIILDKYPECIDEEIADGGRNGERALHLAAQKNNDELVFLLLQRGASATACDAQGHAPLHNAIIWQASVGILQQLVQANADIHKPTMRGMVPLHFAAQHNNTVAAKFLLENKANANVQIPISAQSLAEVVDGGTGLEKRLSGSSAVQLVCDDFGEELEVENLEGWTPLHFAVRYAHLEVAKELLKAHALIGVKDQSSISPLVLALKRRNPSLIEALLFAGYPVFDAPFLKMQHFFNMIEQFPLLSFSAQRDLWHNAHQDLQEKILGAVCMNHYRYLKSALEDADKVTLGSSSGDEEMIESAELEEIDSYLSQIRAAQLWIDCPQKIQEKIKSNIRSRLAD